MTSATALIERVTEVSEACAFQAGVGSLEIAGTIISCLAQKPELIPDFMHNGSEMLLLGTISVGNGRYSYIDSNGTVQTAKRAFELEKERDQKRSASKRPALSLVSDNS